MHKYEQKRKETAKVTPVDRVEFVADITKHKAFGLWADKSASVEDIMCNIRNGRINTFRT